MEAEELVTFIKSGVKAEFDNKREILSTKEDLANVKADIIKWMFIFWIGQIGVIIALLYSFVTNNSNLN